MSFTGYPEYKDSGVEWLGEVPAHWEVKRLRYVAELNPSKTEVRSLSEAQPVSFIPMEAIGEDGTLRLDQTRPVSEVLAGYTYAREGDVTIAKITPCFENGKGAVMRGLENGVGFGTTELIVMRPKAGVATSDYLYRVVSSEPFRVTGESSMYGAGGQKRVPDDFARNFTIAWPPYAEQLEIQAFLDHATARIDALIAEQQRLIALLKEKRQAVISHAVTKGLDPDAPMKDSGVEWLGGVPAHWKIVAIKWLSVVQRGASPRPIDDPVYFDEDGEYGWVRIADVSASNGELHSTSQTLSDLGCSLSVKIYPEELFVSIAGTVGKPCITKIKACIHDGFVYFPELSIDPRFLFTIFESGLCYKGLGKMGTQLNLNTDTVGGIKVALPDENEIEGILSFLDDELKQIDQLSSQARHVTSLLCERRSALISAAVTGKIDVRGWQAEEQAEPEDTLMAAEPRAAYQ